MELCSAKQNIRLELSYAQLIRFMMESKDKITCSELSWLLLIIRQT